MILDHLVLISPTLEVGADHIESKLGVRPGPGGRHNELGTHNLLLRIGPEVFLEVIALDPAAKHEGPRVFGIHGNDSLRLATFVCRTDDLKPIVGSHEKFVGRMKAVTRGTRHWHMAIPPDGSLLMEGALPTPVQYEPGMVPAVHMPDAGLHFLQLVVEHPEADRLRALYREMNVEGPVKIEAGPAVRLRATIRCGRGEVEIN